MTSQLSGRRVLVTRAAHHAGKLSDALRALGLEPVEVPVLEIRSPDSFDALDKALCQLNSYDWLILTSANTVRALFGRAASLGVALGSYAGRVAAIGAATANGACEAGLIATLVPETYVAESLVQCLAGQIGGQTHSDCTSRSCT